MKTRLELAALIIVICTLFSVSGGCGSPPRAEDEDRMEIRIAMCQIFCLDGDRSGNFSRIEHAVEEAKALGADIICFPETAILGWVNPDAHERAHPIPGKDSDRLSALAKEHGTFLCAGLAEKEGEALFDSALLIDEEGRILLKHRKMNILTELMTPPYTPGEDVGVAETRYGRIGILVCADSFKEVLLERMAGLKPDLVLIPYGWAAPEDDWPDHGESLHRVVKNAASKIGAPVVGTDLVGAITHGPWRGFVYGGQSAAADKDGRILAVAKDRDRDIRVLTVHLKKP